MYFNTILSIFVFLFINCLNICKSNTKIWNSNFDYQNNQNWDIKRIPCASDRIIFAEDSVIYLNQQISAKQIILPKNGQIVFGDKASINLIDNQEVNGCDGRDIKFSPKMDYDWFDPFNWNQTIDVISSNQLIDEFQFSGRSEDKNPIPHMERIPCIYDLVSFEEKTTFKVKINTKVKIKSLKIWNKAFDNENFKTFVASDVGKQLFDIKDLNNNLIIDENSICSDSKGCVCGNENSQILSRVCQSVNNYGCPQLECSDPIRPVGHCCDICASMLTFGYKSDFSLDLVVGIVIAFQRKPDYVEAVSSYLHKLESQKFQFIAIDLEQKGRADKMVNAIKQYFNDDTYSGPGIYSMKSLEIYSSTNWSTGGTGLWVLFIFFLMILIGSAIGVSYYLKKRRITAHFAFARFRGTDTEDGVELRMGTTPHEALDPNSPILMSTNSVKYDVEPSKEVVTFENPVFKRQELKDKESKQIQKSSELTSVENPFFSTED